MALDQTRAYVGDIVTARVSLFEASPRSPVEGRPVRIVVSAIGTGDPVQVLSNGGTTDETGTVSIPFMVPSSLVVTYLFQASYTRPNGQVIPTPTLAVDISPSGFSGVVRARKSTLGTGESVEVTINSTGYLPFVELAGENGQPDTTSGPSGDGLIDFIAGLVEGPAKLFVTFFSDLPNFFGSLPHMATQRFYVVSPVAFTAFADPTASIVNDAYTMVRGIVTKNGLGLAGVPVSFTLAGGGAMAGSVRTNADGAYAGIFQAPATGSGVTTITASVVVDTEVSRKTVQIAWGPACADCPVAIVPFSSADQMLPVAKGATQQFSANQLVSWSVTGDGTITTAGNFTAGQTSGTVLIRATSLANSSNFAIARVVVACSTVDEIMGDHTFRGTMNNIVTAVAPFTCSTNGGVDVYSVDGQLQVDISAFLVCGPNRYLWGGFPRAQLETCSIGYQAQSGCDGSGVFGPDPDQPGMTHRRLTANGVEDVGGVCTLKFQGSGILQ